MWDLRKPSGVYFLLLGIVLSAYGLMRPQGAPLTDANVNLWGGALMLLFGGLLLWLSRKS